MAHVQTMNFNQIQSLIRTIECSESVLMPMGFADVIAEEIGRRENRWINRLPLRKVKPAAGEAPIDYVFFGTVAAPGIKEKLIESGEIDQELADIIKQLSAIYGTKEYEFYAKYWYADNPVAEAQAGLETAVEQKAITGLSDNMAELDLDTRHGLIRAMQIKRAESTWKMGVKSAKKYYANTPELLKSELEELEAGYRARLDDPREACNQNIADFILARDAQSLINCFCNGSFKAAERVFSEATGVAIHRLSKLKKTQAINEWAAGQ